jgi:hypothetical protein
MIPPHFVGAAGRRSVSLHSSRPNWHRWKQFPLFIYQAQTMARNLHSVIEQLESRRLFSGSISPSPAPLAAAIGTRPATISTHIKTVGGPTLHEIAGVHFKAAVGFYASPVLDPPGAYSASINWGDGSTTQATLFYGANGAKFGYYIDGAHTYAKPGQYVVTTTLVIGPINPKIAFPTTIIEKIIGKAIVAPRPA